MEKFNCKECGYMVVTHKHTPIIFQHSCYNTVELICKNGHKNHYYYETDKKNDI